MSSRFTEIFTASQSWNLCDSEPCSPSLSTITNDDFFPTSSSDSLNTLNDFNLQATTRGQNHIYAHKTQSFSLEIANEVNETASHKKSKSKLKVIMASLKSSRRKKQ